MLCRWTHTHLRIELHGYTSSRNRFAYFNTFHLKIPKRKYANCWPICRFHHILQIALSFGFEVWTSSTHIAFIQRMYVCKGQSVVPIDLIELFFYSLIAETIMKTNNKKESMQHRVTWEKSSRNSHRINTYSYSYSFRDICNDCGNFPSQMMQDQEESKPFISHVPKLEMLVFGYSSMSNAQCAIRCSVLQNSRKRKTWCLSIRTLKMPCAFVHVSNAALCNLSLSFGRCAAFFQSHWMCLTNVLKIVNRFS